AVRDHPGRWRRPLRPGPRPRRAGSEPLRHLRAAGGGLAVIPRKAALLAAAFACAALPAAAQQRDLTVIEPVPTGYKAKTTPWGEPDFRGGRPIDHLTGRTPLQR